MVIAHHRVHRVLVDNGSSINIIFKKALNQLQMGSLDIKPIDIPLVIFTRAAILPLRMVDLPFSLRGGIQ